MMLSRPECKILRSGVVYEILFYHKYLLYRSVIILLDDFDQELESVSINHKYAYLK